MAHTVAMAVVIAAVVLMAACCQRKPALPHASFKHVPSTGWLRNSPLSFTPEYDDSTATYDIVLAVRHSNTYAYSNLSLTVDFIAEDSSVARYPVSIALADEFGNWTGGGFGTLYQVTVPVAEDVAPAHAARLLVWQVMAPGDTLAGIEDVGIIASPSQVRLPEGPNN